MNEVKTKLHKTEKTSWKTTCQLIKKKLNKFLSLWIVLLFNVTK